MSMTGKKQPRTVQIIIDIYIMKLVIEVDFTNSGKLGSVGSQWSVWVFVVCLYVCVCVHV